MTFWELIRACVRHWPVVLIGALLTGIAGFALISDDGVYHTRTELLFLAPADARNPNALRTQRDDAIITAGVVARLTTGLDPVPKFASPDVTLVGQGVRDGWSLRLPDTGGQWASNYATQRLILDVVGPTREAVAARQSEVINRVAQELEAIQSSTGADPLDFITVMAAPESTVIYHVAGNRMRTLGMTAALGISATAACVILLELGRRPSWRPALSNRSPRTRFARAMASSPSQ